ncbi:metal-dependent cyclase [Aliidiomarina minuta]|uniref:Metal-dependent cyclase n=1 Tax=Aliidiomarina minuta TaxID=880057 RepID=A0A432W3X9_9GAMM|nr:cyclase family protein [Aliidiomarina minuta]RUO24038.1 metal-dependent cyclase [Aliidiomarina minuta]
MFIRKKVLLTGLLSSSLLMAPALAHTPIEGLLADAPSNWGKWGEDDQVGALNYLDSDQVMRGIQAVQSGQTYTLQLPMTHGVGPVFPGRVPTMHFMSQDEGLYSTDKLEALPGGVKYSDDAVFMYLQGTTHVDALGHAWYGDKVYNNNSADSTVHGHDAVDVGVLGEKGVVGHGVLLDVGRYAGNEVNRLAPGSCIHLDDLLNTAEAQDVSLQKRDILLIRTGSMGRYYSDQPDAEWDAMTEPGLCYSEELVQWIYDMEIPFIAADNLAVELVPQEIDGQDYVIPLHGVLMRDLGVVLSELYWLDDLADSSAADGQYNFLFTAAPLKMKRGSGSPVNPIAIK